MRKAIIEETIKVLEQEIEDNINDAEDNNYDYMETAEYSSKKRQLDELYLKLRLGLFDKW